MATSRKKSKKKSGTLSPATASARASKKTLKPQAEQEMAADDVQLGISPELVYGEPAEVVLANDPTPVPWFVHRWSVWLAFIYAAQAAAIAWLGVDRVVSVAAQYLAKDTLVSQVAGRAVYAPATRQIFSVNIRYAVPAFLLVSAVSCALVAWGGATAKRHDRLVRLSGQAVSGTIAVLVMALVVGLYGLTSLIGLAALSLVAPVLAMAFGRGKDTANTSGVAWLGLAANAVLVLALAMPMLDAGLYDGAVPGFVYGAGGILAAGLAGFSALAFLEQRHSRWANRWYVKRGTLLVSFCMQTALAWVIFAGTLLHT